MSIGTRPCKKCGRNRAERFYSGPRGRICSSCRSEARRRASKDRRLRETYGITLDEWEAVLEAHRASDGKIRCAGCRETRADNYRWCVDHDHRAEEALLEEGYTGVWATRLSVRGPLCRRCNKVLRDVRDSMFVLSNLASYLKYERQRTQEILAQFE